MSAQDFSLSGNKSDDIKNRQAVLAMENDEDIERLSNVLKKRRCRVLGKSPQMAEVAELLRKHKTGLFFLDFDIQAFTTQDFLSSLRINYPNFKVIVMAQTMSKEQLDIVKNHGISRFLAKPLTTKAVVKLLSSASFD